VTREGRVREFLARRGLDDDVLDGGAEELVRRWEQAARDAERERYPFVMEDWLNELDVRQILSELVAAVPGALASALEARLADADHRVRAATQATATCGWGDALAARQGWTAERQWWYWRRPRAVNDDFDG